MCFHASSKLPHDLLAEKMTLGNMNARERQNAAGLDDVIQLE